MPCATAFVVSDVLQRTGANVLHYPTSGVVEAVRECCLVLHEHAIHEG